MEKRDVLDRAETAEIADNAAENLTTTSSSGSLPPLNTVPISTDVTISDDGNETEHAEEGVVLHTTSLEEIINEEQRSEVNPENATEIKTPANLPSTSAKQRGNRRTFIIGGKRLGKSKFPPWFYNDPTIQQLTRVLFSPDEPDNSDIISIQNALMSLNVKDEAKKSDDKDNSTDDPPAGGN